MSLAKAILPFAKYNDREVSCTTLTIFLTIAEAGDDGLLQADLPKKLGFSSSAVSRNCCLLGSKTHKNQSGMGLIERHEHPHDSRMKILRLTTEGQQLHKTLLQSL